MQLIPTHSMSPAEIHIQVQPWKFSWLHATLQQLKIQANSSDDMHCFPQSRYLVHTRNIINFNGGEVMFFKILKQFQVKNTNFWTESEDYGVENEIICLVHIPIEF